MDSNQIQGLAQTFLEGFLKGQAVDRLKIKVTSETDFEVLTQDLISETEKTALMGLFAAPAPAKELIQQLDQIMDGNKHLHPAGEYIFDLLMLNLIRQASEIHGEDYLDSPEWLAMEEQSLERGTELLNLLIYLRDCRENEIQPDLTDFLNDFLLVSDEQFQDEFFIYEDLIKGQSLIDENDEQIFEAGKKVEADEIQELFVPILLFFKYLKSGQHGAIFRMLNNSPYRGVTTGIFCLLQEFQLKDTE